MPAWTQLDTPEKRGCVCLPEMNADSWQPGPGKQGNCRGRPSARLLSARPFLPL